MGLYTHNRPTYSKAMEMLVTCGKCVVLQAPGTGKTFITIELLNTLFTNMRVLYVVPTMSIADSVELYDDWNFNNVTFTTYSNLKNMQEEFDVLIIDELHRAGAPTWQKQVERLMRTVKYCLGLSATPYRFLDSRRNMATELFGSCVVYGPDIEEAINRHILVGFDYYAILSDVVEYVEKIESYKPGKDIRFRMSNLQLDEYTLGERIKSHIEPSDKKCIIFYSDSKSLEDADSDIQSWFGDDIKIFSVYSKQSKKESLRNLQEFNSCESQCVVKVVDMFNEGVHVTGVTLLIFARKTISGNVFIQQLGRTLSASNKTKRPKIIDLVQNYNNIKVLKQALPKVRERHTGTKEVEENVYDISQVLVSYDEVLLELEDILAKVSNKWESWEDTIIRDYYKIEGTDVYKRLNDKTRSQCSTRAKLLGVTRKTGWSQEEDQILWEYYEKEKDTIWKRLPGRTQGAIDSRASKLGVIPKWTPEEDLVLMKRWENEGLAVHMSLTRHSFDDIISRAKKLGLSWNGK